MTERVTERSAVVSIDGRVVPSDRAVVSVYDHGFLFGDSVYDVVRTHRGTPFATDAHLERLARSADGIGLAIPWSGDELKDAVAVTLAAGSWEGDSAVRVVVTRGSGPIDISPDGCDEPRLIAIAFPMPRYSDAAYRDGIELAIVNRMRNPTRSLDPSIKSGNYLNSVLALREARRAGAADAVMLNEHGRLTECTTSNLFFAHEGALRTPALRCGILAGVTRGLVLQIAAEAGVEVVEGDFSVDDLEAASEAFITSTTKDILPVARIGDRTVSERPGPITRRLAELYATRIDDLVAAEREDWTERLQRAATR